MSVCAEQLTFNVAYR